MSCTHSVEIKAIDSFIDFDKFQSYIPIGLDEKRVANIIK